MSTKDSITLEEHNKIKQLLSDEILKKDKVIEKLKLENEVLLRSALKRSEELNIMHEKLNKLLNQNNKPDSP